MHALQPHLEHGHNITESAVRCHKVDVRFLLQHGNRGGGSQGFPVDAQHPGIRIPLPAVPDHGPQVFPLPYGIGAEGWLVGAVAPQVIRDDAEPLLQIDRRIFQGAEAGICIAVGNEDIFARGMGMLQKQRVQHIAVPALDGILCFVQGIVEGEIIMFLLPGPGSLQALGPVLHGKAGKQIACRDSQKQQDPDDDPDHGHWFNPPFLLLCL